MCVCVWVTMCVCVCVEERETEKQRRLERAAEKMPSTINDGIKQMDWRVEIKSLSVESK